jgi:hypothetical protein
VNGLEIQTAVEAARRTGGKFVFVPAGAPPELVDALAHYARESGREVLRVPGESPVMQAAREAAARDLPVVAPGDNASFLANLGAIAAGKARVQ